MTDRWEIQCTPAYDGLVVSGWEPFAVAGGQVWLRRLIEPRAMPRRPSPGRALSAEELAAKQRALVEQQRGLR